MRTSHAHTRTPPSTLCRCAGGSTCNSARGASNAAQRFCDTLGCVMTMCMAAGGSRVWHNAGNWQPACDDAARVCLGPLLLLLLLPLLRELLRRSLLGMGRHLQEGHDAQDQRNTRHHRGCPLAGGL